MRSALALAPVLVFVVGAGALCAQEAALALRGAVVYEETCAACHGADARGGNAPDIRQTPRKFVLQALRGIDQMPEIALTGEETDAVVAYLGSLTGE